MAACAQCGAPLPEAAKFCPSCAAPVPQAPAAAEERKLATVLFADLVGSTALGGSQDPERTRAMLDRFYDAMAAEIERVGGTVEKFVGDAVMAAFGAPAALEDHAERALHAALAMQHRLHELFDDRLALRIGVNTGDVVVGRPREGSSFVTGDAVNVGARLEQAAEPGEILAGERTVVAARGAFEFGEPRKIDAKGKPDGIECRLLVRALTLMRPRGVGGLRRAFVGREAELEQLRGAYRRALDAGEPELVTILGEAGVGKSRLVRELWEWLSAEPTEPLRRTGRCLSYGQGITYWPLGEVLKEHFAILENDGPETIAERLGDRRYLGLTLGLTAGEELHPLAARERLHDAWVQLLQEMTRKQPVVMLIEDLHWAEEDLCDVLETIARQVAGPLLLVATARAELLDRRPSWGRDSTLIRLEALPASETAQLLDELLGVEVPASLRAIVVDRAEGNPFFVEELIATLIDRGLLARQNGGWTCAELPEGFEVPDSVQAVLAARIDLLPAAEKAALQAASVIGRTFWTGPVYELVGGAPDFALLEERDFVRRRPGSSIVGEREYAIKHALTREVAYDSVPKAKRARLHASFAAWLEGGAEGDDEHASLLAYHYARAVRPEDIDLAWPGEDAQVERLREQAVRWSRRAAELAIGRYEIDEGLAMLRRAAELEADPARQAELWYEIGHGSALKYDGEGFTSAMEKAIELGGPSAEVYTELGFQTVRRAGMWKRRPDFDVVAGWISEAVRLTDDGSPLRAKAIVSKALWHDDEATAQEAYRLVERLGDVELRSHALDALVNAAWYVGDFERACTLLEERLRLMPEISDPDHRCETFLIAGMVHLGAGRPDEARRSVALLEETAAGLTAHHRLHGVGARVHIEMATGEWAEIRRATREVEAAVDANVATPCPMNLSSLLSCALASAELGDDSEARRLEAVADALGMEGYSIAANPVKLRLALSRRDLTELRTILDSQSEEELQSFNFSTLAARFDALAALDDRDQLEEHASWWIGSGSYVEPFAARALGRLRGDRSLIEQAVLRFEAMGADFYAAETRALL
jgi:class 3 adenylate cyclase